MTRDAAREADPHRKPSNLYKTAEAELAAALEEIAAKDAENAALRRALDNISGIVSDGRAAALRAARAAAIEEAARELEAFGDPAYYAEAIVAIRALGEESAAPREEATEPAPPCSHETALRVARAAAIEEAARVADERVRVWRTGNSSGSARRENEMVASVCENIAAAIRALGENK